MKKILVVLFVVTLIIGTLSFGGSKSENPFNLVLEKLDQIINELQAVKEIISEDEESDEIVEVYVDDYWFEEWQYWINPEEVYGEWNVVSFVEKPSDFDQSELNEDLFLQRLIFFEEEVEFISNNTEEQTFYLPWQDNAIIHTGGDRTVSRFLLKDIDNETYMFYEWKSGKYLINERMPSYYVLKKASN